MKHPKNSGIGIWTTVMGADFVNKAMGEATDFSLPMQEFVKGDVRGALNNGCTVEEMLLPLGAIRGAPGAPSCEALWAPPRIFSGQNARSSIRPKRPIRCGGNNDRSSIEWKILSFLT